MAHSIQAKSYGRARSILNRFLKTWGNCNINRRTASTLPYGAVAYRRRGTRLDRAIQAELAYGEAVFPSELAYLRGEKSLTDHMETLAQSAPLLKEYIELAQDVQAGQYDVWQDVVEVK